MNKIKKITAVFASIMILTSLAGCSLIKKSPEAIKKEAVAKVNGQKITKEQFDKTYKQKIMPYKQIYGADFETNANTKSYVATLKSQTLDSMVMQVLIIQKAKDYKIATDEKSLKTDIDKQYNDTVTSAGGADKLKETLTSLGMTDTDLRNEIKDNIIVNKVYDKITADVSPKDSDLTTYYNANLYDYTEKPDTMEVSHLLVSTKEEADKIKKEIDGGLKFADAAKKYSTDTGTKDSGGSLGQIYYSNKQNSQQYDPLFLAGAIKAPLNKVSDPVKSSYGYHLIYVTKREEYKVKPYDTVKDDVKKTVTENMKGEKFNTTYTAWQKKAKITKYTNKL